MIKTDKVERVERMLKPIEDAINLKRIACGCHEIAIEYREETAETFATLSKFEQEWKGLFIGEEYVHIFEIVREDKKTEGKAEVIASRHLLYSVCVTCNSVLYVIKEAMDVIADKFSA